MEANINNSNMSHPSLQGQSSATQNTGSSRIKSAAQTPLTTAAPSSTPSAAVPYVSAVSPGDSATQLTRKRQINSASQPPPPSTAFTDAPSAVANDVQVSSSANDATLEQPTEQKPLRVSEIISALKRSSQGGSQNSPTTPASPTTSSSAQLPLMAARSLAASTSQLPTRPIEVEPRARNPDRVVSVDGITLGESVTDAPPKTASRVSQLISAMKLTPSTEPGPEADRSQATEKFQPTNVNNPRIVSASQPPQNFSGIYNVASEPVEAKPPSALRQQTVSYPPGKNGDGLPPPLPARNDSFNSSARNSPPPSLPPKSATLPATRGRPVPPTPQESPPVSAIRNRPVPPIPKSSDDVAPASREPTPFTQILTASLSKLNKEPPLPNQNKARTLPARPGIPIPEDLQSEKNQEECHYDRPVYEQIDEDVETRIHDIERNQLTMRSSLQREQTQLIEEVKKLSASVEHLKTWTLNSQQMLVADTTACQESVESLRGRSQDVTRLLREHIVLISQDVSKASAVIARASQERDFGRGQRIMHIFDWNVTLLGGSSKTHGQTLTSHGYLVKEMGIMVTGTVQFSREGNIYLKITGAECHERAKTNSELSGNFTCTVSVTDASDTKPGWAVGRVIGNLFKDNEWVVGTIAAAEVKEKGYCQEGQAFKLKYALDTIK